MNKIWLIPVMMLMMMTLAFAAYQPGQSIDIRTYYKIDNIPSEADAFITITLPNSTIAISDTNMTELDIGYFQYIYTFPPYDPTLMGNYYFEVTYKNKTDSSILGTSSDTFKVGDSTAISGLFQTEELKFGQCPESKGGQNNMWIIMGILILIAIVGIFTRIAALLFISGFILLFMTLITWGCGAVIGVVTILLGLIFLIIGLTIKPLT